MFWIALSLAFMGFGPFESAYIEAVTGNRVVEGEITDFKTLNGDVNNHLVGFVDPATGRSYTISEIAEEGEGAKIGDRVDVVFVPEEPLSGMIFEGGWWAWAVTAWGTLLLVASMLALIESDDGSSETGRAELAGHSGVQPS